MGLQALAGAVAGAGVDSAFLASSPAAISAITICARWLMLCGVCWSTKSGVRMVRASIVRPALYAAKPNSSRALYRHGLFSDIRGVSRFSISVKSTSPRRRPAAWRVANSRSISSAPASLASAS